MDLIMDKNDPRLKPRYTMEGLIWDNLTASQALDSLTAALEREAALRASLAEKEKEVGRLTQERNDAVVDAAAWQSCSNAGDDVIGELRAERDRYKAAVEWALGGPGSNFRPRMKGEGQYWWRTELRRRAEGGEGNKWNRNV